jgi:hypothetical protein
MPQAQPEPRDIRSAQLAIGGCVLLLALALVVYGAPRFAEALARLSLQQTAGALLNDADVPAKRLASTLAAINTLSLDHETPQQRATIGYVLMRGALAVRTADPALYQKRLIAAETALIAALRDRPADSYSWARLAFVRLELRQPLPDVISSWRMSVETAPFEQPLLHWRLGIGLTLSPHMRAADRALLAQQTLNAWDTSRWRTARLLAYSKYADLLRPQLQSRPEKERKEFEKSYVWFTLQRDKQTPSRTSPAPTVSSQQP